MLYIRSDTTSLCPDADAARGVRRQRTEHAVQTRQTNHKVKLVQYCKIKTFESVSYRSQSSGTGFPDILDEE